MSAAATAGVLLLAALAVVKRSPALYSAVRQIAPDATDPSNDRVANRWRHCTTDSAALVLWLRHCPGVRCGNVGHRFPVWRVVPTVQERVRAERRVCIRTVVRVSERVE